MREAETIERPLLAPYLTLYAFDDGADVPMAERDRASLAAGQGRLTRVGMHQKMRTSNTILKNSQT